MSYGDPKKATARALVDAANGVTGQRTRRAAAAHYQGPAVARASLGDLVPLAPDAPAVPFAARRADFLDYAGEKFLELQLRAVSALQVLLDRNLLSQWQLIELVKSLGIAGDYAYKQMRLERGESTENTALVSKVIMGVHTKRGYTPAGYPDAASPSASPHEPSDQKTGGQGGTGNQG